MLGLFLSLSLACTNLGLGNRFVYLYANSSHHLKRLCNRLLCNHSSQWLHFQAQGNSDFSHAETRGELEGGGGGFANLKGKRFHFRTTPTTGGDDDDDGDDDNDDDAELRAAVHTTAWK